LKSTMCWKFHGSIWVILCHGVVWDYIFVFILLLMDWL
jgi:hypothetical protein